MSSAASAPPVLNIDGSILEGGGQILRNASALAALTGQAIRVEKIRAGRSKPGLAPQHLSGLELITAMCNGELQGGTVRSTEITLTPCSGGLQCGEYIGDTKTAGSCTLMVQAALPCALFAHPHAHAHQQQHQALAGHAAPTAARPAATSSAPAGPAAATAPTPGRGGAKRQRPSSSSSPPSAATRREAPQAHASASTTAPGAAAGSKGNATHAAAAAAGAGAADAAGSASRRHPGGCSVVLHLKGGTDAEMAPPVSYLTQVLVPQLQRLMGVSPQVDLVRRGFYPRGGGEMLVTVQPLEVGRSLPAFDLTQRGQVQGIHIQAFTAGKVRPDVARRMADSASQELRSALPRLPGVAPDVSVRADCVHEPPGRAMGDGTGIIMVAHTDTGCLLGASARGQKGVTAEAVGATCAAELLGALRSGSCVDEHMQDQLIVFMALAKGRSRMLCGEPTLHSRTAMVVSEMLLPGVAFKVTPPSKEATAADKQQLWLVECEGAGYARSVNG